MGPYGVSGGVSVQSFCQSQMLLYLIRPLKEIKISSFINLERCYFFSKGIIDTLSDFKTRESPDTSLIGKDGCICSD